MNTYVFPAEQLAAEAAKALNAEFSALKGSRFLFLSSGGSSLALLDLLDASNFGPWSAVAVLDERFSPDPAVSNFAQLAKTRFFAAAAQNGCSFIDTMPKAGETIVDLGARFEKALREWLAGGGPVVATIGIGPDAHTSGIMPYPEDAALFARMFDDGSRWAIGYDAGPKSPYPLRITVTLPFLRSIRYSLSYVKGADKKDALAKLFAEGGATNESPCRILRELPRSDIFTDQQV